MHLAIILMYIHVCIHNVCVEGVIASSPQDEEYARQLQREEDEEYARQLHHEQVSDRDVSLSDQEDSTDIVSALTAQCI